MKIIVLAAGQGTRLKPLTENVPKCMVPLKGKPLIDYQLDLFKSKNIKDITIVGGYLIDKLENKNVNLISNNAYETTNMVHSLFCAKEVLNDDVIISYGDIVYKDEVLQKLIDSNENISIVVDKNWKEYWKARMDDPLSDAETLKIKDGKIIEIGKKPYHYGDIEGQYIGLIKFSKEIITEIIQFYNGLDKNIDYDGNNFNNMYMTTFLSLLGKNISPLKPIFIYNGWMEVDCPEDLNHHNFLY